MAFSLSPATRRICLAFCCALLFSQDSESEARRLEQTLAPVPTQVEEEPAQDDRKVQLFVYGGSNAPRNRYPYLVSIKDEFGGHRCTAILIHPLWVLSAAHCVVDFLELHIGAYTLSDTAEDGVEIRTPKATFIHESWTGNALDGYDIVLFQLGTPSSKAPIKLDDGSQAVSKTDRLTIAGWGKNGKESHPQEILQHATSINTVDLNLCGLHDDWPVASSDNGLCAIGKTQNTCQGDSGGPLLLPDPNQRRSAAKDTLIGITSFGHTDCTETKYPTYFTSVSRYHAWIQQKISDGPSHTELNNGGGEAATNAAADRSGVARMLIAPLCWAALAVVLNNVA